MTGCSAINCSNHSKNEFKFHRFPADPERWKKWLINCRRKDWNSTQQDRICSIHFEESQYEESRVGDKRRLRPFAVPTLFDVPNPPKLIMKNKRESIYKRIIDPPNHIPAQEVLAPISNDSHFELNLLPNQEQQNELDNLKNEVTNLKAEINGLRNEVIHLTNENEKRNALLSKFMSKEQLSKLSSENRKWGTEGILKGLKFSFA